MEEREGQGGGRGPAVLAAPNSCAAASGPVLSRAWPWGCVAVRMENLLEGPHVCRGPLMLGRQQCLENVFQPYCLPKPT